MAEPIKIRILKVQWIRFFYRRVDEAELYLFILVFFSNR